MGCEKVNWLNLGFIILRKKWKISLDVRLSALCIKINHPKKYDFVYDVETTQWTIHELQDLKLSSCSDLYWGGGNKNLNMVFQVESKIGPLYLSGKMGSA